MARLEYIDFVPHRAEMVADRVHWNMVGDGKVIKGLPQIFWKDGTPWREANLWACQRATCRGASLKTVQANATALLTFARWLEENNVKWWDFPAKKADRCLVRFRGALIDARDRSEIAPSTASERMASVIRFYRWLSTSGLVSPLWPMWKERTIGIRLTDSFGFERTITVNSTDLNIANRKARGERLEDGLLPVSEQARNEILSFAKERVSEEFFLMLALGFFTGMRLGTICDLKIGTLDRAVPDPAYADLFRIAVGPGADPPVHTKFGVTGNVWITRNLLEELRAYAYSARRLSREGLASPENKELVFLTRFGNTYGRRGSDMSSALNVEMHTLRRAGISNRISALRDFKFHQCRCTFATELARLAISLGNAINAISFVKDALLHKSEAQSLKYIRFVQKTPIKIEMANAFTRDFLGVLGNPNIPADA